MKKKNNKDNLKSFQKMGDQMDAWSELDKSLAESSF